MTASGDAAPEANDSLPRDIEAVLFDLDDTLVAYRRSGAELIEIAFETAGVEPVFDLADYYARYEALIDESEDMVDLRERCFVELVTERGYDEALGRELAATYTDERDQTNVRPLQGALEAIDALHGRYPLGLVTNGAPGMQRTKLGAVDLDDRFDARVFGGYDVPAKPDPVPVTAVLESLGVAPDRALMVGNSLETDVRAARAAGVPSVWVPDGDEPADPDPAPDYRLDSLAGLPDLLE